MALDPPPPLKKGDELTLKWLNGIRDWLLRNTISLGLGSGLAMTQSPNGTNLRLARKSADAFLCVTNGAISACGAFSGSTATAGSGSVYICSTTGTTITKTTKTLSVLNFSTTSGGIASGVNVWVTKDENGNYWIVAVDCGN